MTPRVACDTNVLVSALIAQGPPSRVLEEAIAGRLHLVVPEHALGELERVLREKLDHSGEEASTAASFMRSLAAETPATPEAVPELSGDSDDDAIIAAALRAEADVLVSGDRRHVLPLERVGTMRILTPQALLAELRT